MDTQTERQMEQYTKQKQKHSGRNGNGTVNRYRFTVHVPRPVRTHNEILAITESLRTVGCADAVIFGHKDGLELLFNRPAASLKSAISSVTTQIERAGFRVIKVETEKDSVINATLDILPKKRDVW
jgi:hypothetical protein